MREAHASHLPSDSMAFVMALQDGCEYMHIRDRGLRKGRYLPRRLTVLTGYDAEGLINRGVREASVTRAGCVRATNELHKPGEFTKISSRLRVYTVTNEPFSSAYRTLKEKIG